MFCVRPFIELTLHHDGKITPCCHLFDYEVGKIENETLTEMWNNPRMQNLRAEFLRGEIKTCQKNIEAFGCHRDDDDHFLPEIERTEVISTPPKKLDLRLNGQCNLECIMCEVWKGPNHLYDETSFWRDGPTHIFPHLKEIDLLGGEPFIQKDTFKLIDQVSTVNRDCLWNFTTNSHWNLTEGMRETLDKIMIKRLTVSIDSIFPDTFRKIRLKGDLKQLLKNVSDLKQYQRETRNIQDLRLNFLIQKYNYRELSQFIKYCEHKDLDYVYLVMKNPHSLSLYHESAEDLKIWLKELESLSANVDSLISIVENIIVQKELNHVGLNQSSP